MDIPDLKRGIAALGRIVRGGLIAGFYIALLGGRADPVTAGAGAGVAIPLESPQLPHCFQISPGLWSGSQPSGDAAFAELVRLGVATVVSVDGAPPDVASARRHGLRYIHIPFGYDGIPSRRVAELVRAAAATNGPVFVHCHHGQHRGPAAAALLGRAAGIWTADEAESFLRQAGTSPEYPGLYRAVREFRLPPPAELERILELPETAPPPKEVAVMVDFDQRLDRIRAALRTGGTPSSGPSAFDPSVEAVLLWEQIREWRREPEVARKPSGYGPALAEAETAALTLSQELKQGGDRSREEAVRRMGATCSACHKQFRN